jgi:hypothetical protein
MNLRKLAKGKPCTVLLEGCDGGGETTVLAHIRKAHVAGVGQKPHDLIGVWSCFSCHNKIDARAKSLLDAGAMNTVLLYALCRTLAAVGKELDARE